MAFDRVVLRVPRDFVLSKRIVGIDHGGREWVRGAIAVQAIDGRFAVTSFDNYDGSRCVAELRGGQVLLIERVSSRGVTLVARPRPLPLCRWLCPHMPAGAAIEPLDRSHRLATFEVFTTAASTELLRRR